MGALCSSSMRCLVQPLCMGFHVTILMDVGPMMMSLSNTKLNRLCLKADLNAKLYLVCSTSSAIYLFQLKFHGVPFGIDP